MIHSLSLLTRVDIETDRVFFQPFEALCEKGNEGRTNVSFFPLNKPLFLTPGYYGQNH